MALYNDLRPMTFKDVLGQETAVRILKNGLLKKGDNYPQCNIFIGPHGTGKTTCARILAKVLNCENPKEGEPCCECDSCKAIQNGASPSVYELDAASNNGVDDARAIIEQTQYIPIGKKKVFILDEVQMLSNAAWNAFLKVFEEPPKDIFFILCTTEALKVSATANSRCQEVLFKSIAENTIISHLKNICDEQGIRITDDAVALLASQSGGHMRDAISDLDKYSSYDLITKEIILDDKGLTDDEQVRQILIDVLKDGSGKAFEILNGLRKAGKDTRKLCGSLIESLTAAITGENDYLSSVSAGRIIRLQKELVKAYPLLAQPYASFYLDAVLSSALKEETVISSLENEVKSLKKNGAPRIEEKIISFPSVVDLVPEEEFIRAAGALSSRTVGSKAFEPGEESADAEIPIVTMEEISVASNDDTVLEVQAKDAADAMESLEMEEETAEPEPVAVCQQDVGLVDDNKTAADEEREVIILTLKCVQQNEAYQFASLEDLKSKKLSLELSRYEVAWSGKSSLAPGEISVRGKDKNTSLTGKVVRVGDIIVDGNRYYFNDLYKVIEVTDLITAASNDSFADEEPDECVEIPEYLDENTDEEMIGSISMEEIEAIFEDEPAMIQDVSEDIPEIREYPAESAEDIEKAEPEVSDSEEEEEELSYEDLLADDENICEDVKPVEENIVTLSFDDLDFFAAGSARK